MRYCSIPLSLPVLQGRSSSEAVGNVKERLVPVLKANWLFWPLVQVCGAAVLLAG